MYLFHFTDELVDHEEVFSWFKQRKADWMLNHTFYRHRASSICGVYDVTLYDEFVALEFVLAFGAIQGESPELKKAKAPGKTLFF